MRELIEYITAGCATGFECACGPAMARAKDNRNIGFNRAGFV
jgi:hypothetical protein